MKLRMVVGVALLALVAAGCTTESGGNRSRFYEERSPTVEKGHSVECRSGSVSIRSYDGTPIPDNATALCQRAVESTPPPVAKEEANDTKSSHSGGGGYYCYPNCVCHNGNAICK